MSMTSHEIRRYELEAVALDALRSGQREVALEAAEKLLGEILPDTSEDAVIRRALLRLVGRDEPLLVPHDDSAPWEGQAFQVVAQAWCQWADGQQGAAEETLSWLHLPSDERTRTPLTSRLVLYQWGAAVGKLLEGDLIEARSLWRSAIDLGGQLGADATPAIRWTYYASAP